MKKITLIDLNNFAYYPTLAIGYIIALLRQADFEVELLSPLNSGVIPRNKREPIENWYHYLEQRVRFSENKLVKTATRQAQKIPSLFNFYHNKDQLFGMVKEQLPQDTDLILISSYLHNHFVCRQIAKYAKERSIPVIIGGPAFNMSDYAEKWISMEGVDALVGVEVDGFLTHMINDFFEGKDISKYPGVYTKHKTKADTSHIFKKMDKLPPPDFTDFPWDKYPVKIIPYLTARGCAWEQCNFCTDVTYVNGRSFRSMKAQKVLNELKYLAELHQTNYFYLLDLKINSDLHVWYSIINELKNYVDNPKWVCSVHVDGYKENGLAREHIFKAKESGLLRITFGLESGSQRILNHMKKGTKLERIKDFIKNVHDAGISLRGTLMLGYPYETAEDLRLTYEFLEENGKYFDRLRANKFGIFAGAPIYKQVNRDFDKLIKTEYNDCYEVAKPVERGEKYAYYKKKILKQVHKINSTPLIEEASDFEGVM